MKRRKFLATILKATALAPVVMAVPKALAIGVASGAKIATSANYGRWLAIPQDWAMALGVAPAAPKNLRIIKVKNASATFIDALDRGCREEIDAWIALKSGHIGTIDGFTFYETECELPYRHAPSWIRDILPPPGDKPWGLGGFTGRRSSHE